MENQLKVLGTEHIGNIKFTGIEGGFGQGKKAMLVKDIALIHRKPIFKINELINNNRKRFEDGIDILDLKSVILSKDKENYGFNQNAWNRSKHIYLLSERGYAKLLKIMDDDKAWDIYDELVDNYFNMRVAIKENKPAIVNQERLAIMKDNSATKRAGVLYKIAMATDSNISRQKLLHKAAEALTGEKLVPVMQDKYYSVEEVGQQLSLPTDLIDEIANQIHLKAEYSGQNQYGSWINSDIPEWFYTKQGIELIDMYKFIARKNHER